MDGVALRECGGESERGGGGVSKKETNRRIGSLGLYERFGCVGHMGLHVLRPTRIPLLLLVSPALFVVAYAVNAKQ
ncbi:hypothetical protein VNO80_06232 [Phaseolus coccineus]|uniref:Uncharacterized protein n=1 Tax=Phaseolus coccineus TaxID=3886 RepID=A0AAN9RIJ1_PHACN